MRTADIGARLHPFGPSTGVWLCETPIKRRLRIRSQFQSHTCSQFYLVGRAIYVTGKPSLFRSSRTHRRLEDPISLRFSLRNSRKIFALVGPRCGGCNPPLSCGGSRPLPSVEMRQRWLQRKWFALLRFRAALAGEASLDEAAQRAKSAASFKGGMRTLGARLMDHSTCTGLFGPTRRRARPRGHRR